MAKKFVLIPENLHDLFLVSNPIVENVRAEGVCNQIVGMVKSSFEIKLGVIRFNSKAKKMLSKG